MRREIGISRPSSVCRSAVPIRHKNASRRKGLFRIFTFYTFTLIRGFADFVRNTGPEVIDLHLYGPDDRGSSKALKKLIKKLDLETNVTLHDPVYGDAKCKVLSDADLFCLTSRFEGHPIAVLEALSYGLPCLLTPGTNMAREVSVGKAGWSSFGIKLVTPVVRVAGDLK